MAYTPPTSPDVSYGLSPFGFGPFPLPGTSVDVIPPHPTGGGYGGVGFLSNPSLATGGSPYGLGSYGSRWFSRPKVNISGGYGGDPYGLGSYGSTDVTPPFVASAVSLNGYTLEVFFSEEVDASNVALTDPSNYTLEPVTGAAPASVVSVHIEKLGSTNIGAGDFASGVISVVLTHTGTTLGGTYRVHAVNLTDIAGNVIMDSDSPFIAKGDPPGVAVSVQSGNQLLVAYSHDMLANSGGYGNLASYTFKQSSSSYPINIVPQSIEVLGARQVALSVQGMTTLTYDLIVTDALDFSFDTVGGLFECVRVDTGTATVTESTSYLVVSKAKDVAFAMEWQDLSGGVAPLVSTLRGDCTFDFSNVGYLPAIATFPAPEIAEVVIQDGVLGDGLLVRFTLQYSITGVEQIRVRSGTYDQVADATWSDGVHTLSFVRNMQADTVTFLLDDGPLFSTSIVNIDGAAETQAGIRFSLLDDEWDITGVRVYGCRLSSSMTVFSAAWNFLHDQEAQFVGSGALARDRLLTQRGPLVKDWGDATPATVQDVAVLVNDVEVEVAGVNPYIGEVVLAVPVPLMPVGQISVAVDYKWFKAPIMEMAGLNTPGLVLNKHDHPQLGHHDPAAHGDQIQVLPGQPGFLAEPGIPKGAVDTSRFPMSVVLGPMDRPKPLYIGHRYIGFERAYSALTNSPTTLLLNQVPGRVSLPGFDREVAGVAGSYEGLVHPGAATPVWALDGVNYGGIDHASDSGVDLGTLTIIDPIVGDAPDDAATVYHRGLDQTYPSSINLVARFKLEETLFDAEHPNPSNLLGTPIAEGVFTGVGFGLHDNLHLYLVGVLLVNGVEHVGLLQNPKRLHEWDAWNIGPKAILAASSQTSGSFPTAQVPTGFTVGSRFQRLEGTQMGVYTATSVVAQSNATTRIEFTPALPSPWDVYGNKYAEMVFETRASAKPFTYRLDVETGQHVAELRISGETTGVVAVIDGNVPQLPTQSSSTLLLQREITGQVFWGSLSRQASNRTRWSFLHYGLVPDQVFIRGQSVVINTEMAELPEANPGGAWFPDRAFGNASVDSGSLLLKATSGSDSLDLTHGYFRVEPFFTSDSLFDFRAMVRLDSSSIGAGGAELFLNDTQRQVKVRMLLIREGYSDDLTLHRSIVHLPSVSYDGMFPPDVMGWASVAGSTLTGTVEGAQFVTRQGVKSRGRWENHLIWGRSNERYIDDDDGRVLDARFEVVAVTANSAGDTGIVFGCQMDGAVLGQKAVVQVELGGTPGNEVVRLRSASGSPLASYSFDWSHGVHTYRVLADRVGDAVSLVIDQVVQVPPVLFSSFSGGINNTQVFFGCTGRNLTGLHDDSISATVEWHSFHVHTQAPADLVRTLGVLRGGVSVVDEDDINNYELPRVDVNNVPNSWLDGPEIEWWDWRSDIELRVYRDPSWGVTVFRPDLPPPPYYQPEDGTSGSGFTTDSVEPSAGWINVEYRELPRSDSALMGIVGFGSLRSQGISQSSWGHVRYRLFKYPTDDLIAPEHMVLNQFNVITSGELGQDRELETVIIQTMDRTRISLLPTHMYAKSVYKVLDGDTIWTGEDWVFDSASQLLSLQPDALTGEQREFSADHANVTVMFVPGTPVTTTYLRNQPLLVGVTLLNDGTPPVPKSQVAGSEAEQFSPSIIDPYQAYRHKNVDGTIYDDLEFLEISNEGQPGLLTAIDEGGPGQGFSGFTLSEGEDIFSKDGAGAALGGVGGVADHFATGDKVGSAIGAEVFDFSGTQFWLDASSPSPPDFGSGSGSLGGFLYASGGSFVNPVVDESGNILHGQWTAGGGVLGSAVLYPSFPSKGPYGGDQGRIYQRTDWFLDLKAVVTFSLLDGTPQDHSLEEDWGIADWGDGTATGQLASAGDYSRYGPWGGWNALSAARDWAGWVLGGLVEGSTLPLWDRVGLAWVTFTARAVPLTDTDFLLAPNPHTELASVINAHSVTGQQYEAVAGLTLSGQFMVLVYAYEPSTDIDLAVFYMGPVITGYATVLNALPTGGDLGVLTGGAKITQSSLLAGGNQNIDHNNMYDARLGMVALGGSPLPEGLINNLIFI